MAPKGVTILSEGVKEARQLYLFDDEQVITRLDARLWHGSFNSRESTLQQLSPYVGKMKSGMAKVLVKLYSRLCGVMMGSSTSTPISDQVPELT